MTGIVFYSDRLVPEGFAGCTRAIFIFIRPQYKDDAGLHAHERVHVRQYLRSFGLMPFFYLFSEKYRYKAEVEAYRRQLQVSPGRAEQYATFITTKYNLNVSYDEALADLER